jgi:hypothetical protein
VENEKMSSSEALDVIPGGLVAQVLHGFMEDKII